MSGRRVANLRQAFLRRPWIGGAEFIQKSGMKITNTKDTAKAQRAYRAKYPTWKQFKADYVRRKAAA
jgi:hypothetical protein